MYLHDEVKKISVDNAKSIPWLVWLLENPQSPISLPGKVNLYNHDCLHILLGQDISASGEASVVGFCMGSDSKTNKLHLIIFKIFSHYLYPKKFRFSAREWCDFKAGFFYGRSRENKDINKINFAKTNNKTLVTYIRRQLGVCPQDLNLLKSEFHLQRPNKKQEKAEKIQWSSSFFGAAGGILVASKTAFTPFGFILLAFSSSQLLLASAMKKDKSLVIYAGSIFFCVDLLGIYRWLLSN